MKYMAKRFGALSSSQNPEQLANKVKGVVLALSSIVIYLASQLFGIELRPDDVVQLGTILGSLVGGIWAVYGVVLHLIAFLTEVRN